MTIATIISCVVSLLSGGLAGNIYAQHITKKRNAKQKIVKEVSANQIHKSGLSPNFKIAITEDDETYQFENFYTVTVKFINAGNIRIERFDIKLDMPETFNILKVTPTLPSRAREIKFKDSPSYKNQLNSLDFELTPFNRKDPFSIDIQVYSTKNNALDISKILIDSSTDIEFIKVENETKNDTKDGFFIIKSILFFANIMFVLGIILLLLRVPDKPPHRFLEILFPNEMPAQPFDKEDIKAIVDSFLIERYKTPPQK